MTDGLRGAGRTTALMLRAISDALLSPGQWVEFVDHYPHSPEHDWLWPISTTCRDVGLRRMHVRQRGTRVFLLSDPSGMFNWRSNDPSRQLPALPE